MDYAKCNETMHYDMLAEGLLYSVSWKLAMMGDTLFMQLM